MQNIEVSTFGGVYKITPLRDSQIFLICEKSNLDIFEENDISSLVQFIYLPNNSLVGYIRHVKKLGKCLSELITKAEITCTLMKELQRYCLLVELSIRIP